MLYLTYANGFCLRWQIDEEETATRRDLSVPSSLEAPPIDLTSRTAKRYLVYDSDGGF